MEAIIFDIDGVLADCSHRLHLVKGPKKDYDTFYSLLNKDSIIYEVKRIYDSLYDVNIVLITGRPETCRKQTEEWLDKSRFGFIKLYMRKEGDYRKTVIVKKEILDQIRAEGYNPWLAFEDHPDIAQMYRDNGVFCLQTPYQSEPILSKKIGSLTLMVGPSGGGKTTYLEENMVDKTTIISSDNIRQEICGDHRDQSKNDEVFAAVHDLVSTRLRHGLPTVVDATNLRNKDRLAIVDLAGPEVTIQYIVIDRPILEKMASGGWRNELGFDLIGRHQQIFESNLKDILTGDNRPNVKVIDMRTV